ncbi:hypothetical protein V5O48_002867 [Marasmius crinis-equi]|uniref:AN1-type domain-containing protein n=1 Tax=Marasmius crinis-equi TaxID=585013 RepID=A0ABR3FUI5_9AGAR
MTDSARATPTPEPERDQQLLSIGKQCTHASCNLVDFLPFKCQHCKQSFCQEHFKVEDHSCPSYDASKHDRIAPSCPLCNTPVAIPPGQDPNVRMEQHFVKECSVMLGKEVKKSKPVCARAKCGKVLHAPIRCDKCRKQFCPSHRFPGDHTCTPTSTSASSTRPGAPTANSRLLNLKAEINKASSAGAATVDAIKKTMSSSTPSSTQAPAPAPIKASASTSSSAPSSSSHNNPFSKTDRYVYSSHSRLSITHKHTSAASLFTSSMTNDDTKLPNTATDNASSSDATATTTTPKLTPKPTPKPVTRSSRARAERESRKRALRERAKKGLLSEQEKAQLAAVEAEDAEEKDKKDCIVM